MALRHLLLRRWQQTVALPKLHQGSTLVVRSRVATDLVVQPAWRDDGHACLRVSQQHALTSSNNHQTQSEKTVEEQTDEDEPLLVDFHVDQEAPERITSLGRLAPHVSIDLKELLLQANKDNDDDTIITRRANLTLQVPEQVNLTCDLQAGGNITVTKKIQGDVQLQTTAGGNISVTKLRGHYIRLQNCNDDDDADGTAITKSNHGATSFDTTSGQQQPGGGGGTIRVDSGLEASRLEIQTSGRVRAKQIHGASIHVSVNQQQQQQPESKDNSINDSDDSDRHSSEEPQQKQQDADDEGSLVDISALFVSPGGTQDPYMTQQHHDSQGFGAVIDVHTCRPLARRAVRVKSHHGPLQVTSTTVGGTGSMIMPTEINTWTGQRYPIVELGGVNGNCEVILRQKEARDENNNNRVDSAADDDLPGDDDDEHDNDDWDSCLIHVDSLEPETVSVVTADHGNVGVTLDRKVESDVRFLSFANKNARDNNNELFWEETTALLTEEEDPDMIVKILEQLGQQLQEQRSASTKDNNDGHWIQLETHAFTPETPRLQVPDDASSAVLEYVQGNVQNKSAEPDSRFERKMQGSNSSAAASIGKINLQGAAHQALSGFSSSNSSSTSSSSTGDAEESDGQDEENSSVLRPLVAVLANGRIRVETVSWLGAIARRYGLDEEETTRRPAGRTAARRGRSFSWETAVAAANDDDDDSTTTTKQ